MSVLRTAMDFGNKIVSSVKRNRRVPIAPDISSVRLNLGCGMAVHKGWINIDGSPSALIASFPMTVQRLMYRLTGARAFYSEDEYCRILNEHIFIHHDLSNSIPISDEAVDFIFSSHFLEHLDRASAVNLLSESYRVLKHGALIRISIPDLEYAIGMYADNRKIDMLNDYFFVEDNGNEYSRHKYMYDYEMLSNILTEIGFSDIRRCSYRSGELPDIEKLDNRPEDSLYVEASK